MDKTPIETRKTLLNTATNRIRDCIEENLIYSHLASKDTMDIKSRNVHGIYERRMRNLNTVIQQEMDKLEYNLARMIAEDRVSSSASKLIDTTVVADAVADRKDEIKRQAKDEAAAATAILAEADMDMLTIDPAYVITTATGQQEIVDSPVEHGKVYTYSKRKCRCTECKKAKSARGREYRRNRQLSLEPEAAKKDMRKKTV